MSVDDDLARWKHLATQAKQGSLTLTYHPDAAHAYAIACRDLIDGIKEVEDQIGSANRIDGLGDFAWAGELRDGLNGIVSGPDNSMQDTLDKYMQVAQLMSDTVNAAVGVLTGQDEHTADNVRRAGGK